MNGMADRIVAGSDHAGLQLWAEAVFSILALSTGILPPTINVEDQDPECDLDVVPNAAREKRVDAVLSNSFGFGGTNAVICFKRA